MAKRTYMPSRGGYVQVRPHKRKKSIHVKAYCRRKPGRKSYAKKEFDAGF